MGDEEVAEEFEACVGREGAAAGGSDVWRVRVGAGWYCGVLPLGKDVNMFSVRGRRGDSGSARVNLWELGRVKAYEKLGWIPVPWGRDGHTGFGGLDSW